MALRAVPRATIPRGAPTPASPGATGAPLAPPPMGASPGAAAAPGLPLGGHGTASPGCAKQALPGSKAVCPTAPAPSLLGDPAATPATAEAAEPSLPSTATTDSPAEPSNELEPSTCAPPESAPTAAPISLAPPPFAPAASTLVTKTPPVSGAELGLAMPAASAPAPASAASFCPPTAEAGCAVSGTATSRGWPLALQPTL